MVDDTTHDETEAKTMWSEALLESLYTALKAKKDKEVVLDVVKELRGKGYETQYLINKVKSKLGNEQAEQFELMLGSKSKQDVSKERVRRKRAAAARNTSESGLTKFWNSLTEIWEKITKP